MLDKVNGDSNGSLQLKLVLILATILTVYLRTLGLNWGVSDQLYLHPDEANFVVANALKVLNGEPLEFLNYPQLTIYLTALGTKLVSFFDFPLTKPTAHIVARSISVLLSSLTLIPIYLIGKKLSNSRWIATLSVLVFAIFPAAVWLAHFGITDNGMTLAILSALYASLQLKDANSNAASRKWLILTAAFCGLAAGFKYTGGIVVTVLLTVIMASSSKSLKEKGTQIALVAAVSFVVFALCTPISVLHPVELIEALRYEAKNAANGYTGLNTIEGSIRYGYVIYPLVTMAIFAYGPFLYALAILLSPLVQVRRHWPLGLFLLIWGLLTFFNKFQPLRYYLPFYLVVLLLAISALPRVMRFTHHFLAIPIVIIVFALTGYYSYSSASRFLNDTRVEALHWLDEEVERSDVLMAAGAKRLANGIRLNRIIPTRTYIPYDIPTISSVNDANILMVSSLDYSRYYQINNPRLIKWYEALFNGQFQGWQPIKSFSSSFFLKDFVSSLNPIFGYYFISPDIKFFRREPQNYVQLPISVSASDGNALKAVSANDHDWHSPESWGAWARNASARLFMRIADDQVDKDLKLRLDLYGYSNQQRSQVEVFINGRKFDNCEAIDVRSSAAPTRCSYVIPHKLFEKRKYLNIILRNEQPFTRKELEGIDDYRRLGVGLRDMEVVVIND